ncbi:unnamed protein product [Peronospora belbahrii]|uniref:C2H2-type domain-containing protein n=1 Tax=Peronospora belbahrii TaxID=622444 RepID=A0AAU9KMT3_9STRA|nr:unnamed protein product [Peronospora belbahrii]CAH0518632.1 unnamed protein product [Peronospora belbahrii]
MREDYPPIDHRGSGPGPGPLSMNTPHSDHRPPYGRDDFRGQYRSDSRENHEMRFRGPRGRSRSPPRRGRGGPMDWDAGPRFDDVGPSRRDLRPFAILPEPLVSYKVWMMRQTDESAPEVYQQRYEEYKKKHVQRVLRAFFELHKREEWMQERYSPALRYRVEKQKTTQQINEAKQFGERLRSGTAKICLDEQVPGENCVTPMIEDFANDLEHSARVLYVRRVPCACPVGTLSETIKKAGGPFVHLYLSDPVKKSAFDFDRSAYIIYESAAAASDAMPKIHNTFVEDGNQFPPFRLQVSPHRTRAPLKTPSYLSVPERLTADYKQSLGLAKALDARLFYGAEDKLARFGIETLLASEEVGQSYSSDKEKLDVIVAYLRRVHHYIYYAGVQCLDMGDIMHAHPALFCRPPPSARDIEEEKARQEAAASSMTISMGDTVTKGNKDSATSVESEEKGDQSTSVTTGETAKAIGGWASALDEKVQTYLKELAPEVVEAKRAKNRALVDEIEAREEAALESTYANYGEKASDDGKHRCRLCTKLFKAMDFVKKHIRNKHPELVVDKVAEVGESYMWEQYREDEQHPMPPLETINTMPGGALLGGRGGHNCSRNGGGYRGRLDRDFGGGGGGRGFYRDDGYRGRGPPMRDDRMRRGSFDRPPRSPPRHNGSGGGYGRSPSRGPPPAGPRVPDSELPVDPRQVSTSYRDLDNLQDTKVELSFDALDSLPPPKKKTKV